MSNDNISIILATIEEFKNDIKKHMNDKFKDVTDRQDKTNGSVARNVIQITRLRLWRSYIIGGIAVILFMLPLVGGVFIYFLNDLRSDLDERIVNVVETTDWEFYN